MAITGLTLEKASGALKRKYIDKKRKQYIPKIVNPLKQKAIRKLLRKRWQKQV